MDHSLPTAMHQIEPHGASSLPRVEGSNALRSNAYTVLAIFMPKHNSQKQIQAGGSALAQKMRRSQQIRLG